MVRSLLIGAAFFALAGAALAQDPTAQRDPDAMAALDRMAAAMRSLQSFSVRADYTRDQVLTTDQKLQFAGTVDIKARRPNALRIDMQSDRQARVLYYDGRTATLFSPRIGYYASFPAPPTIGQVVAVASEKYGIDTPLADLFAWGSDPAAMAKVRSAFDVGTETIRGRVCEHYAVRQSDADWQVWISKSGAALPCKLVITTTDDPSRPEFSAIYEWNTRPTFAASDFAFTPPAGARKIAIAAAQ